MAASQLLAACSQRNGSHRLKAGERRGETLEGVAINISVNGVKYSYRSVWLYNNETMAVSGGIRRHHGVMKASACGCHHYQWRKHKWRNVAGGGWLARQLRG
jgi:hypothetical protein